MDAVFLQGVILVLCVLVAHFTSAAKFLDGSFETIECCTLIFEYLGAFAGAFHDTKEHDFGGDIFIAKFSQEFLCFGKCFIAQV